MCVSVYILLQIQPGVLLLAYIRFFSFFKFEICRIVSLYYAYANGVFEIFISNFFRVLNSACLFRRYTYFLYKDKFYQLLEKTDYTKT